MIEEDKLQQEDELRETIVNDFMLAALPALTAFFKGETCLVVKSHAGGSEVWFSPPTKSAS